MLMWRCGCEYETGDDDDACAAHYIPQRLGALIYAIAMIVWGLAFSTSAARAASWS